MRYAIEPYGVSVEFDSKPCERVRSILKASGFRWNGRIWNRRRVKGAADVLDAIRKAIEPKRPDGRPVRPDGPCWTCKAADGYFRNRGAAAPVLCDRCAKGGVA